MPSPQRAIDLRSDLLAPPTAAMKAALLAALDEPAAFDPREDPHQRALERQIAALLGHEDALLFPTCTMANQTALALLAQPGEAVLAQAQAHILTSEAGAAAALSGLQIASAGESIVAPDLEAWRRAIVESRGLQPPRIAALSLENTHNRAGGRALPPAAQQGVLALAREFSLPVHLDGARLFNAAIALATPPASLAAGFDTVSVSLNKALGAPWGAALALRRERSEKALHLRQRLGGGMRRLGPIAAAAAAGLADFSHIHEDHRRAKLLGEALAQVAGLRLAAAVETNIVLLDLVDPAPPADRLGAALASRGVQILALGARRIRLATHRGVADADLAAIAEAFAAAMSEFDGRAA